MKRVLSLLFALLLIFSFGGVYISASELPYSVDIPDYYEEIGENKWYSEAMTINGKENKVWLTITTEAVSVTEREVFSYENIEAIKAEIKGMEEFTNRSFNVKTEMTISGYKYIYATYEAMVDDEAHTFVNYIFYSENECVTVAFEATNPVFIAFALPGFFVDEMTFDDNFFFEPQETFIVPDYEYIDDVVDVDANEESVQKKENNDFLLPFIAITLWILLTIAIACLIYLGFDHGNWSRKSKPDPLATILSITSKKIWLGRNNHKFLTTVTFSDGFVFTTTKTDRKDMLLFYKISISDELKQKIVNNAMKSHAKAIEKLSKKKGISG